MTMMEHSDGLLSLAGHYGVEDVARFLLSHVETLKQAEVGTVVHQCGLLLEGVVEGFGIGSEAGLMLIGMGQALLGNPLTASSAAAVVTNPVVMTCAAIGAVHYGWKALGDKQRTTLLALVARAFNVGVELVRSVIGYALDLLRTGFGNYLPALRKKVAEGASYYGRTLGDVTHALGDRVYESCQQLSGATVALTGAAWQKLSRPRQS